MTQEKPTAGGPLLTMHDIVKTFPGVRALDGVDLDVRRGEVHCLLGQNGAGKSTLIKVLSGAHQPDGGEIRWEGELVHLNTPGLALDLGIGPSAVPSRLHLRLQLTDALRHREPAQTRPSVGPARPLPDLPRQPPCPALPARRS